MGKESVEKARNRDREAERKAVIELFDKVDDNGKPYSRNRIIKETGVSGRQVTKIAREEGYKFDRSSPGMQAMMQAYEADARAARARVSQQVLDEIAHAFKRMHEPHIVIGWHQGMAFEHSIDRPTAVDYKNYATVLGILIDKHLVLERYGQEDEEIDGSLGRVQAVTEVARLIKAHPDMSIEDIIAEVVNR